MSGVTEVSGRVKMSLEHGQVNMLPRGLLPKLIKIIHGDQSVAYSQGTMHQSYFSSNPILVIVTPVL